MIDTMVALAAGLVGALITLVVGLLTLLQRERHREAELARREVERRDQLELDAKVVARLLLGDTVEARYRMRTAKRNDRFWSAGFAPRVDTWEANKADVARYMDLEDWEVVSQFFRTLASLEAYAAAARGGDPMQQPVLTTSGRHVLDDALVRSERAGRALERFTGKTFTDEELPAQ